MPVASSRRITCITSSFALFLLACGVLPASMAAPFPDPLFGVDGTVRIGNSAAPLIPTSATGLSDGRVVVASLSSSGPAADTIVSRLAINGLLDPSFGSAGRSVLSPSVHCARTQRLVRRLDESVDVLTSSAPDASCTGGAIRGDAVLPSGGEDNEFTLDWLPRASTPRPLSASLDRDGRLYVAGTGEDASSGHAFVARIGMHGAPDPAFGGSGQVKIESGSLAANRTAAVAALDDGTVRTASIAGMVVYFAHFDPQGNVLPAPNGASGVAVDLQPYAPGESDALRLVAYFRLSDGANLAILKIEGATKSSLLIIRGADNFSSYGSSRLIDSAPSTDWPAAAALPDGSVVIAELTGTGAGRQASIRRMFANSSFDATWGSGRAYPLGAMTSITDMQLDFNTRLLIAGTDSAGGFVKRYKLVPDPFFETAFVVEYFNDNLNHFFMTTDPLEVAAIEAGSAGPGWGRTLNGFRVYTSALGVPQGTLPVCRFYGNPETNPATGQRYGPNSHVYVLDGPECDQVRSDRGWVFEGHAFWIYPSVNQQCGVGLVPVYRVYNGRFVQNDSNHRFTSSQSTYQSMLSAGWRGEGVVMCAPQQ